MCIITFENDGLKPRAKLNFGNLMHRKITISKSEESNVVIRHIRCTDDITRININKIKKAIGGYNTFLCNNNEKLPLELKKHVFDNYKLMEKLCVNSFMYMLCNNFLDLSENGLLIYDLQGEYADLLLEIVKYVSNVTVISDKCDKYADIADAIFYDTGALVHITDNINLCTPYSVILSPKRIEKELNLPRNCFIFTSMAPKGAVNGNIICDFNIPLAPKYEHLCPAGIDIKKFTCALYLLEGFSYLDKKIPTSIKTGTGEYDLKTFAGLINKSLNYWQQPCSQS